MLAGHLRTGVTGLLLSALRLILGPVVGMALALGLTAGLAACGGTYVAPPPVVHVLHSDPAGAQAALETLVRDVHDRRAASPGLDATLAANAKALDVEYFTARYISDEGGVAADGSWAAQVDITWRFGGFDATSGHETVTATFVPARTGGSHAVMIRSFGGGGQRVPLWLTGPVTVRRTPTTLVLVAGNTTEANQYDQLATRAVAAVRRVVPWPRARLVVEVPASESDLEQQLQVETGSYSGVAAVTATDDGSAGHTSPVHVFVNPAAIGALNGTGAQVVLSHEATHAATDAVGSPLPAWLREGFADYVALHDVPLPLSVTAKEMLAQVRRSGPPAHLPSDADFNEQAEDFGTEYEAAWLVCRTLAQMAGEGRLVELYDRVRAGAPLDASMRHIDGFGVAQLTTAWQRQLRTWARP